MISIYTDGSCLNNPGPGACAYVVIENDKVLHEEVFYEEKSTNSRMEMKAMCSALHYIEKNHPKEKITIYTDSSFVKNTITSGWMFTWQKNNWKKSDGKLVANPDLVKDLYFNWAALETKPDVKWVKAHAKNKWNNYCDILARSSNEKRHTAIRQSI